MKNRKRQDDPYIGSLCGDNYRLEEKVDQGNIGIVYKAVRQNPNHTLACKVIPEGRLKDGWERELEKVIELSGIPGVVPYRSHSSAFDKRSRPFTYVFYDFIHGKNLRNIIEDSDWPLNMAFIEGIAKTILEVLHACQAIGIFHGDLHEGNILISDPDVRLLGKPRRTWITDFGYGGSHNALEPRDDYRQLCSILANLLNKLRPSDLNPRDKLMHAKLSDFIHRRLLESDPTQQRIMGNPQSWLEDFNQLSLQAEKESAAAKGSEDLKEPGDYLWAEAFGNRAEEWKALFVPEFLAVQDLLSKNITVLTGARGCGKTMAFRRLTVFMDKVIGQPSGVKGADTFVGFYLNCRDLVEAFPWLPATLTVPMKEQIIHYFHLSWMHEICKTLAICDIQDRKDYRWLDKLFSSLFPQIYQTLQEGTSILDHVRAFVENQKEMCRLTRLGNKPISKSWPLARLDFLDKIQAELENNVSWISHRPVYCFLDDYTVPIVTREVQQVLNVIIFKRRSKLFFKVSTEASNSFERKGLRGKPLELHQDFELIDLATESIHQDQGSKEELLDKIFLPRINRHQNFKGRNCGLKEVLGKTPYSNNELAKQMRFFSKRKKKILYHGSAAFIGMWSSDIRIMIQMFSDMFREANGKLKDGISTIPPRIQDKVYRAAGGEFLGFAESVNSPSYWEKGPSSTKPGDPYGRHLRDIVEAFISVSRYELTTAAEVSNQGKSNPRQAFRIEVLDKFDLPEAVIDYYRGLVRWHIFLQDWRGKSVRGMLTPRLFMNRVLIPFSNLTFSSHDNIQLHNHEFINLLKEPQTFLAEWKKKKSRRGMKKNAGEEMNQVPLYGTKG